MTNRELIERWQRIATETKEPTMYRLDSPDSKSWMADFLIETAEASIAALSDQWIPVSERLPEHGKCVALLFETNAVRLGFQSYGPKVAPKYYFQPWGGQQWQLQPIAWCDCIPAPPED